MYCKNCGNEISNFDKFCKRCGYPQRKYEKSNTGGFIAVVLICSFIINITFGGFIGAKEKQQEKIISEQPVKLYFDVTEFYDSKTGKTVSQNYIISKYGEPDERNTDENFKLSSLDVDGKYTVVPLCEHIDYYKTHFYFINNQLVKCVFLLDEGIICKSNDDILPMFGLRMYDNSRITRVDTYITYNNCGVYKFLVDYDARHNKILSYKVLFCDLSEFVNGKQTADK